MDFAAFGTGLMRDQGLADQFLRKAGTSRLVLGDLDAAGFSPAAGMDLRFDDEDRRIQFIGPGRGGFGRSDFLPSWHGNTELGKQRLGLKFMNVHLCLIILRTRTTTFLTARVQRAPPSICTYDYPCVPRCASTRNVASWSYPTFRV